MSENTFLKRAIELCLAVYRITDKFPREEVLRARLRSLAVDTLEYSVYSKALPTNSGRVFNLEGLERKIRVLFVYFVVAEKQGWVNAENFRVLEAAYRDFYHFTVGNLKLTGSDPVNIGVGPRRIRQKSMGVTKRQVKILEFLKDKEGGSTISDIAKIIAASNKTAERDLKILISAGKVTKRGNTKGARFLVIMDK